MKYFRNIMVNAITGAIIGSIFLLPYLGWLYSGHGMITLDWTKRFFIVGLIWGVVCGITISLVPIMINSSIAQRITTGMIVGGLAGIIFYLIGDLALFSKDSLSTILFKSLWGLGLGIIGGGICALALGILNRALKWIRFSDTSDNQNNQHIKRQIREKVLSALVGLNIGAFIGNLLLVVIGQIRIIMYGMIYFNEILLVYLLPILFGCFIAIYLFIRPLRKQLLLYILDGLRNGIIFSVLFIIYFALLLFLVFHSSSPRPELMRESFLLEIASCFIVVFTALFGLFEGITGATLGSFFFDRRVKQKERP